MSLNDPHWGRSSDEEKKNDRGDNEQRSDGVGEDGEEQNARQNPNAQDDRNPADSSADGSRRTSRDAREDDEQRDRRSQGLLSDDDLENLWSNFQQAANKIMGRQGRSNQEDLRSRLKSRDDFSRDDEPNDLVGRLLKIRPQIFKIIVRKKTLRAAIALLIVFTGIAAGAARTVSRRIRRIPIILRIRILPGVLFFAVFSDAVRALFIVSAVVLLLFVRAAAPVRVIKRHQ
jgi:hypothetical protein